MNILVLVQVLEGHVLIGGEEVKPVIWLQEYVTTSGVEGEKVVMFTWAGTCRFRARRKTILLFLVSG